ncbi:preprotein translocase subunit SecA [Aureliella helgolandensis]|uniref:Protein translocase subunit SecA n=2 Tax=Aureliella helgolandensis TaxID=2527968 RepID=A0A518G774_9BACT|nr:preprotein translocase subunit SecA [Aureliella helgolandensis]
MAPGGDAIPESSGKLPSRPRIAAGLRLPGASAVRVRRWTATLREVANLEPQTRRFNNEELRKASLSLRFRAMSGEPLLKLMPEAFALVREAGRRALNMRHFDVQIVGGAALCDGCITEMQTGEGKTLTATLPLYLHSLANKGAHLATVNDYLAERDAQWMEPIYQLLGLTVGVVLTDSTPDQRRKAYGSDVTYGTAKEFGFDFLRDRLLLRAQGRMQSDFLGEGSSERWSSGGDEPVQRTMHFALVDEADSILIDEARTPLIIGSLGDESREMVIATFRWAAEQAERFEREEHYTLENETRKVELTGRGRSLVRALPREDIMRVVPLVDLYDYIERAIKVHGEFIRDRQYVVRDDEIVIVDEFTGRLAEGRKWRDGIHQAIEAKEKIEVSVPTGQAARITVQDLFQRYRHLAGMTGTASTSSPELAKIYKTPVVIVPTNRPPRRVRLPDRVFGTMEQKFEAIIEEIKQYHEQQRPVLIGTRSIDKSMILSKMLENSGIKHDVLNANQVEREAEIVAEAGKKGRVTVATNMAGRGTDVKLDQEVRDIGGMHVICTELHDAARIDRQLIGRCGRQGDPGSYRQYMSLDDDILRGGYGNRRAEQLAETGRARNGPFHRMATLVRRAQRRVERKHFRDRMMLLHHERERTKLQREIGQDTYLDTAE